MDRRFLLKSGLAGSLAGISSAAVAQSAPKIRWRLTSGFPKSLDTLYGGAELFAKYVAEATDNNFVIQVFSPGEIVGALQAQDAVSAGTVEMAHTTSLYAIGKDPAFVFGGSVPFGMNARQANSWIFDGGGEALLNGLFEKHNIVNLTCGNTGVQMGGFFRKQIGSLTDFQGLKFRISGMGGTILQRLGAVPQLIAGGDVYPALERGTIDGAEFVGPYDDEKLGLWKVAKYYYYPAFWDGGSPINLFINLKKWNELPKAYQTIVRLAASEVNQAMLARYDARNAPALRRLVAQGASLHPFPTDLMEAAYKVAFDLYEEYAKQSPEFERIYRPWLDFRTDSILWFRVGEYSFDNFIFRQPPRRG